MGGDEFLPAAKVAVKGDAFDIFDTLPPPPGTAGGGKKEAKKGEGDAMFDDFAKMRTGSDA